MEFVKEYIEEYLELGGEAFVTKFDHPFLLYPDRHGHGGFRSYHTQMADRAEDIDLTGSLGSLREYRILTPASSGRERHGRKLLVGRSEERDLSIDHSTVSKRHAFLLLDDEKNAYKLGDAGSTNGTFLNGKTVESGEPIYLNDGNVVSFGDCDYLFYSPAGFATVLGRLAMET